LINSPKNWLKVSSFKSFLISLSVVNNLRLKLDRASVSLEDLAAKGPLKPEGLRGLDEAGYDQYAANEDITVTDGLKQMPPKVGVREVKDASHYRTGWLISEEMTKKLLDHAMEIKQLIHVSSVAQKRVLTKAKMTEQLDIVRGLMMMAYPGFHGLGDWEPIWVILENNEEHDAKMDLTDDLDAPNTTLWAVNKELTKGKLLQDIFGKNEKTKLVVKAVKKGGGAPQREPMIDGDTHKKMLAFYHKKTEEGKHLQEQDDGDQYMNSAWANNKNLKNSLHGMGGDTKWKF
jgi:hypothetical protein